MTRCSCGRPVETGYLCTTCTRRLEQALRNIPDNLADELDVMLTRQTRFSPQIGGSRPATRPLPYSVQASEAAWILRDTLTTTARVLTDQRHLTGPTAPSERLTAPHWYTRTTHQPDSPRERVQRCQQTDLPHHTCHHCRQCA